LQEGRSPLLLTQFLIVRSEALRRLAGVRQSVRRLFDEVVKAEEVRMAG
jgi:hypothetical protein